MKCAAFMTSIKIVKIQLLSQKIQKKLKHNSNNFLPLQPLFNKLEKQFSNIKKNDYFFMISQNEYINQIENLLDSYIKNRDGQIHNSLFTGDKKTPILN